MLSSDVIASSFLNMSMIDPNIACVNSALIWILVHFVYSCVISTESSLLVSTVVLLNQLRFINQPDDNNPDNDEFVRPRRHHFISLIKEDMIVVFLYVLSAFLYTWLWLMKSYRSISYMYFIRWFIEATCSPFIICTFYCGLSDVLMANYKSGTYMTGLIMLKLPVFLIIRCAETGSIVILDRLQAGLFYLFCDSSNYYFSDNNLFNLFVQ